MSENEKGLFAKAVEKSLGDFFGDEAKSAESPKNTKSGNLQDSPFTDLNAIVLSIEWEITDQIMKRLITETDSLMKIQLDNKIIISLLKLLRSVGSYIYSKT